MRIFGRLRNLESTETPEAAGGTQAALANAPGKDCFDKSAPERANLCVSASTGPSPRRRAPRLRCVPNAKLDAFSALPVEQKLPQLHADAAQLGQLLAARAQRGGSPKWEILVVDAKGGSGHTIASAGVRAVLQDPRWPLSQHLRVGRADFHGDESGAYATSFDALMADENGQRIRMRHIFKAPVDERVWCLPWRKKAIRSRLEKSLQSQGMSLRPDVVVCVQSAGIAALEKVTLKMGAQLRVQPTDFGLGDWHSQVPPHPAKDLRMRYDLPVKHSFVVDQLRERGLHNYNTVGMPLRREFSELPRRLASNHARVREAAQADVHAALHDASGGAYRAGDRSVVLMMGGKGARPGRFLNYIEGLLTCGPKVLEGGQKLHVYVPAVRGSGVRADLRDGVVTGVAQLRRIHSLGAKSVEIHLLPRLGDERLARLMQQSVCITKAGGLTSFELASLGARALLNMRLSQHLPWERNNVRFLQERGQGFALPVKDAEERAALGPLLQRAWAAEVLPVEAPDFAAVYHRSLGQDALAILGAAEK